MKSKIAYSMLFALGLFLAGCGGTEKNDKGCGTDIDCPGDLICVDARCTSPEIEEDMSISAPDLSAPDMSMDAAIEPDLVAADMNTIPVDMDAPDTSSGTDMTPDMRTMCPNAPTAAISSRVWGTVQYTSNSITAGVEQQVELTAANSSDPENTELVYTWAIASSPTDSMPILTSPDMDGDVLFRADVMGTYQVELKVTNANGVESCNTATFEIVVEQAGPGITYVLTWQTPAVTNPVPDMGADVDIHYMDKALGEWNRFQGIYDIYWRNLTADWGAMGTENDPILSKDSQSSFSGEIVHHALPEDRVYAFGVHYYADNTYGPSYATITLYVDGQMRYEFRDQFLQTRDQFWYAIDYDVATDTVTEVLQVTSTFPNLLP